MNNSIYYMLMAILAELQSQRPELGLAERTELQQRADSFKSKAFDDTAKMRLIASSRLATERIRERAMTDDTFSCPAAPLLHGLLEHE